jgi:hypothetical protein
MKSSKKSIEQINKKQNIKNSWLVSKRVSPGHISLAIFSIEIININL